LSRASRSKYCHTAPHVCITTPGSSPLPVKTRYLDRGIVSVVIAGGVSPPSLTSQAIRSSRPLGSRSRSPCRRRRGRLRPRDLHSIRERALVESPPVRPDLRGSRVALGLVGRTDFGADNGKFVTDLRARICAAIAHRSRPFYCWLSGSRIERSETSVKARDDQELGRLAGRQRFVPRAVSGSSPSKPEDLATSHRVSKAKRQLVQRDSCRER
jgi:hypothetical protein